MVKYHNAILLLTYEEKGQRNAAQELQGWFTREGRKFILLAKDSQDQVGQNISSSVVSF